MGGARRLPLARAIRGEASEDVELLVKSPRYPEGAVFVAYGRPLRDPGSCRRPRGTSSSAAGPRSASTSRTSPDVGVLIARAEAHHEIVAGQPISARYSAHFLVCHSRSRTDPPLICTPKPGGATASSCGPKPRVHATRPSR